MDNLKNATLKLESVIREMRNEKYFQTKHIHAHERIWETEEEEEEREKTNKERRKIWDAETESLIKRCYG